MGLLDQLAHIIGQARGGHVQAPPVNQPQVRRTNGLQDVVNGHAFNYATPDVEIPTSPESHMSNILNGISGIGHLPSAPGGIALPSRNTLYMHDNGDAESYLQDAVGGQKYILPSLRQSQPYLGDVQIPQSRGHFKRSRLPVRHQRQLSDEDIKSSSVTI